MTEREYKFILPERLTHASASPGEWSAYFSSIQPEVSLKLGSWQERDMQALYFDTTDFALSRQGISLRLRREAGITRLTLKLALEGEAVTRDEGLSSRLEWERETALDLEPCPSAAALRAELEGLFEEHQDRQDALERFEPLLSLNLLGFGDVRFVRREVLLEDSAGPLRISWSADRGHLRAGGHSRPLAETEFELLEGNEDRFDGTVRLIAQALDLQPMQASKDRRLMELVRYGLIIIGGGPAGLMAAIAAKETSPSMPVLLLERMETCGRKLNATGNGRGNIGHTGELAGHYHSVRSSGAWIKAHTEAWDSSRLCDWFAAHGLPTETDEAGRIYPLSKQARSVTRLLTSLAEELGVDVRTGVSARSLRCLPGRSPLWQVDTADGVSFLSEQVVVASGGSAQPNLGSDGSGWTLLRDLGLTVSPIYPALVQLTCDRWPKRLSGIRLSARLTAAGHSTAGELLLTDYGLSGIVSLELSLLCARRLAEGALEVRIDLAPDLAEDELRHLLLLRRQVLPRLSGSAWAEGIVPDKLAAVLAEQLKIDHLTLAAADEAAAARLAVMLKAWQVTVKGTRGMPLAQVSLGGLELDQLEPGSCAVKGWPGLYVCGEVLDLTGETGGYNLHLALTSGLACGIEAGRT